MTVHIDQALRMQEREAAIRRQSMRCPECQHLDLLTVACQAWALERERAAAIEEAGKARVQRVRLQMFGVALSEVLGITTEPTTEEITIDGFTFTLTEYQDRLVLAVRLSCDWDGECSTTEWVIFNTIARLGQLLTEPHLCVEHRYPIKQVEYRRDPAGQLRDALRTFLGLDREDA